MSGSVIEGAAATVCGGGKGGRVVEGSGSISLVAASSGGARIDLVGIKGVVGAVGVAVAVAPGAVIAAADALFVVSGRAADGAG